MKHNKSSIIWGIIIVMVGIIFLGNNLNIWNIDIFFDGWWSLFIIIPSIISLWKRESFFTGILGLLIGILLLLAAQGYCDWHMVGKIFLPVVIIMIGLSLIVKPNFKHIKTENNSNKRDFIGIFSSPEEKINDSFQGSNCVAIFGGVDLDLRDAKILEDITIDCVSIFGGIDIKVPDNVYVKSNGVPIFGGIENKVRDPKNCKNIPTIYINYVCIFGGIDIL